MDERSEIEQAIRALEAQRAVLGDAVLSTVLKPLHERLARLTGAHDARRRHVTVLFADVSGFTAMSERLDAELVADTMNAIWRELDAQITTHGGLVDKHIGDCVMALFGAEGVREDDAERAIQAALRMQARLTALVGERADGPRLAMRIGLHTGPVLLGEVGSNAEYTAMGDTVNLAKRLESAAPVGGVLVSHATYREVHGVFDVETGGRIEVKGKTAPIDTYVIRGERPRAERARVRGIADVETRMAGRDRELTELQDALASAEQARLSRAVTVLGDAGLGKSRLIRELVLRLERRPDSGAIWRARAIPTTIGQPYGLLRDLLCWRFGIADDEPAQRAWQTLQQGFVDVLGPDGASAAALLACLAGLPGPDGGEPATPDLPQRAELCLAELVAATASDETLLIVLEDVHWADDASLDLFQRLCRSVASPVLTVFVARPALLERRQAWADGQPHHATITLEPLSPPQVRALLSDLLQRADSIPQQLFDRVAAGAEGNPYYVEEFVQMLLDDGTIVRGDRWEIRTSALDQLRVPPTLKGLLQARLDGLPADERSVLQRAAVVGRTFWDDCVATSTAPDAGLTQARARDLVLPRETSAFDGCVEYAFKHAVLRDVAYDTVLLAHRRPLHDQTARWLVARTGDRLGDFALVIADHFAEADRPGEAYRYLLAAAHRLVDRSLVKDADELMERVDRLEPAARIELSTVAFSAVYRTKLDLQARRHQDRAEWKDAVRLWREALTLAEEVGDRPAACRLQLNLSAVLRRCGDHAEALVLTEHALETSRALGLPKEQAIALQCLASLAWHVDTDLDRAERLCHEGLQLADRVRFPYHRGRLLTVLTAIQAMRGRLAEAVQTSLEAESILREHRKHRPRCEALVNLAELMSWTGRPYEAREHALTALRLADHLALVHMVATWAAGTAALELGLYEESRQHLESALARALAIDTPHERLAPISALLLLAAERPAAVDARALFHQLKPTIHDHEHFLPLIHARFARAIAAQDPSAALTWVATVAEALGQVPGPRRAQVELELACAAVTLGESATARAHARSSLAPATGFGMRLVACEAHALLARHGEADERAAHQSAKDAIVAEVTAELPADVAAAFRARPFVARSR